MIIIGTFQHSIELEQALGVIEQSGIPQHQLLLICMDSEPKGLSPLMGNAINPHSKGVEVGFASATGLSAIGASVGFILPWGPIICGLLACFIGFGIGFGVYYSRNKRSIKRPPKKLPEIIVIVQCKEEQSSHVREIMWAYHAITVGCSPEPT